MSKMEGCNILLFFLFLCPILVESFTFPGDWHKIRQMMKARWDKQQLNKDTEVILSSQPLDTSEINLQKEGELQMRGSFMFVEEEDESLNWDTFQFSTTTTTPPPPAPLPLADVMQDLMSRINVSQVLTRENFAF